MLGVNALYKEEELTLESALQEFINYVNKLTKENYNKLLKHFNNKI